MCISNLIFKMAFGRHDGKMNYFLRKNLPLLLGDYLDDLMDWNFAKRDYLVANYPHVLLTKELRDGVKVKGYFFKNKADNNKLAVCVHGYNSEVLQDNSPNALFYLEHGFDVNIGLSRTCFHFHIQGAGTKTATRQGLCKGDIIPALNRLYIYLSSLLNH